MKETIQYKSYYYYTRAGQKRQIDLYCGSLEELDFETDLLICSAFKNSYFPNENTLIGTLQKNYNISVGELAKNPDMNMKDLGIWFSKPLPNSPFHRIACLEMEEYREKMQSYFETVFFSLFKGNRMGYGIENLAMPLIGTGNQSMDKMEVFIPLITESLNAFEFVDNLKKIIFFERDSEKFQYMCEYLDQEIKNNHTRTFFISYSHKDALIANQIADILEKNGAKVWIDHKKIRSANYPEEIIRAIESSTGFIILVSQNSQSSADVQRELRNAGEFERSINLQILPILLDLERYNHTFSYYLAGHNYYDLINCSKDILENICQKIMESPV